MCVCVYECQREKGDRVPYLEAVIRPTTELEHAGLFVEWEILDVNLARGFVDGRWLPFHQPLVVDGSLGGEGYLEVTIRAAIQHVSTMLSMSLSLDHVCRVYFFTSVHC